eukprot:m.1603967 g.1603967  ORF g.1603967 m.1603967 type:complete len:712 (-) comp25356_c0_seq12:4827-6962(-)
MLSFPQNDGTVQSLDSCSAVRGDKLPIASQSKTTTSSHTNGFVLRKRAHALSREGTERLATMMLTPIDISPCACPVDIVPFDFVQALVAALNTASIRVQSVKLEGSGASHVVHKAAFPTFNDLDIVLHLSSPERSDLTGVRDILFTLLQKQLPDDWMNRAQIWDIPAALISKMWISAPRMSDTEDSWALFTLGGTIPCSKAIDLKIVQHIQRPYQFSIDSLRIDLTELMSHRNHLQSVLLKSEDSVPTGTINVAGQDPNGTKETNVVDAGVRVTPNSSKFSWAAIAAPHSRKTTAMGLETSQRNCKHVSDTHVEQVQILVDSAFDGGMGVDKAIEHLSRKYISVSNEDEMATIRGGGLLKFVSYLQKGFTIDPAVDRSRLLKYMVTRFLMDYPSHALNKYGIPVQLQVLSDYIRTHLSIASRGSVSPSMEIGSMRQRFLHKLLLSVKAVEAHVNLCEPLVCTITYLMNCITQQMITIQRNVAMSIAAASQQPQHETPVDSNTSSADSDNKQADDRTAALCEIHPADLDTRDLAVEMRGLNFGNRSDNGDHAADDCDSCSVASEDSVASTMSAAGDVHQCTTASATADRPAQVRIGDDVAAASSFNDLAAAVAVPLFYPQHHGIYARGHAPQPHGKPDGQYYNLYHNDPQGDGMLLTHAHVRGQVHHGHGNGNHNGGKALRGRKSKRHARHVKARSKSTPVIQRNHRDKGHH